MKSTNFLDEMQLRLEEVFKSQDPELFYVVFEIDGKTLYAHKHRLLLSSKVFKSMLSDFRNTMDELIKIDNYKFEDFKEFLTFLYSGECELTDVNIFAMLDISEFYQITHLRELCDQYLSKMKCNLENIFAMLDTAELYQNEHLKIRCDEYLSKTEFTFANIFEMIEISNKYSLDQMKKSIQNFVTENVSSSITCNEFLNADKSLIEEIVKMKAVNLEKSEEIFQLVYEWSKIQAIKKQKESNDESFNMNDAIKKEITPFLPKIKFNKMGARFLNTYVVKKGFLFSHDELSDILESIYSDVQIKITNLHGQSVFGALPYDSSAIEVIKSLKNRKSDNERNAIILWKKPCKIPLNPSSLIKRDGVKWYLIYFSDGDFGVRNGAKVDKNDYLIAEMFTEKTFRLRQNAKAAGM